MKIVPSSVVLRKTDGTDLDVVNAARVSFHKESTWEIDGFEYDGTGQEYPLKELAQRDVKLINYLAKHGHWTPFGHINATFVIKAPIFVARQLAKHQVGLVWNEVSRRYVDEEPEFWMPLTWRGKAENAKQGSSDLPVELKKAGSEYPSMSFVLEMALSAYKGLLEEGVAPEQARIVLPLNTMTEWWWTGSIAAWARVCKLRLDPHAQLETREIAESISRELAAAFPVSWKALMES